MTTDELRTWKRLNECECVRKVKREWELYDLCYDAVGNFYDGYQNMQSSEVLWIPPLYDHLFPGRSLIGISNSIGIDAETITLFTTGTPLCLKGLRFVNRPDLALARAIIAQEGNDEY